MEELTVSLQSYNSSTLGTHAPTKTLFHLLTEVLSCRFDWYMCRFKRVMFVLCLDHLCCCLSGGLWSPSSYVSATGCLMLYHLWFRAPLLKDLFPWIQSRVNASHAVFFWLRILVLSSQYHNKLCLCKLLTFYCIFEFELFNQRLLLKQLGLSFVYHYYVFTIYIGTV